MDVQDSVQEQKALERLETQHIRVGTSRLNLSGLLRDTETEKPIADIVKIVITRR